MARSLSVRNLAVEGRSGSVIREINPIAIENDPKMMKTYIHCSSPVVMWPTAYPMSLKFVSKENPFLEMRTSTYPPNMVAIPFVQ